MDAFANYQPLDYEHIALNHLIQKLTNMDMGSSSSDSPLDYEQTALNPLIQKVVNMDMGSSYSQTSAWDKAAVSSSSGASGWTIWSKPEACDLRE